MNKSLTYILLIAVPFAVAAIAYFFLLPDQIPVQLTTDGIRYANKAYVFLFALAPVVLYFGIKRRRR